MYTILQTFNTYKNIISIKNSITDQNTTQTNDSCSWSFTFGWLADLGLGALSSDFKVVGDIDNSSVKSSYSEYPLTWYTFNW